MPLNSRTQAKASLRLRSYPTHPGKATQNKRYRETSRASVPIRPQSPSHSGYSQDPGGRVYVVGPSITYIATRVFCQKMRASPARPRARVRLPGRSQHRPPGTPQLVRAQVARMGKPGFPRVTHRTASVSTVSRTEPSQGILPRSPGKAFASATSGSRQPRAGRVRARPSRYLLDPLAQLVVSDRAHQPLREQADDLVVGALEVVFDIVRSRLVRLRVGRPRPPMPEGISGLGQGSQILAAAGTSAVTQHREHGR